MPAITTIDRLVILLPVVMIAPPVTESDFVRQLAWAEPDAVVFDETPDPTAWPDVSLARDGLWYVIHVSHGWTRVDVRRAIRDAGNEEPALV